MFGPESLWSALWGDRGQYHEVRVAGAACWIPCVQQRALSRILRADDCMVSAVPRTERDPYALAPAWILWARLEAPECGERLRRLAAGPTLVIREGASSRRTVLWALSEPLRGDWITRATERLAYHLKGRRKAADASALIPSPFTRITIGRSKPQKVWIEYESDQIYTARQIVGGLKDAPAKDGWRAAA